MKCSIAWEFFLSILRCPYCHEPFQFEEQPQAPEGCAKFGVLICNCSQFAVIDGIPIIQQTSVGFLEHTTGRSQAHGIAVSDLVDMVRGGKTLEAMLVCLTVNYIPRGAEAMVGWRLSHGKIAQWLSRTKAKRTFFKRILGRRDVISARDVLGYYYFEKGPLNVIVGHYFKSRFSQPRHLAALALAETIPSRPKPILDIACGIGHLSHYFCCRDQASQVVGLDMNFHQLWIARHWVAPSGQYVCANAADALPFADASFSATVCSDAYHYIPNAQNLLREIDRCAPNQRVVLTRVGNASITPNEGVERTLDAYLEEFNCEPLVFDEESLLNCYLKSKPPIANSESTRLYSRDAKWFSFYWNYAGDLSETVQDKQERPHTVGKLGINPIYKQLPRNDGDIQLVFKFPDTWYAYENHAMLSYHPRRASISKRQISNLSNWQEHEDIRALVDSYVLIGMPARY